MLPFKYKFFSNYHKIDISDKDYNYPLNVVWNTFNIKNLGEYHDLYVQSDTLLLSCVFEAFRNTCIKEYELDPTYFVSAPGLWWIACLKKTKVKLELLTDVNMLLMFENGIRGGISQVIHKYAKANNKYMKNHNKNISSSFLMYLDANNLYGYPMINLLPIGGFKWDDEKIYTEDMIKNFNINSKYGAVLEVDIEYPKELHNLHRDLPFLCKRVKF